MASSQDIDHRLFKRRSVVDLASPTLPPGPTITSPKLVDSNSSAFVQLSPLIQQGTTGPMVAPLTSIMTSASTTKSPVIPSSPVLSFVAIEEEEYESVLHPRDKTKHSRNNSPTPAVTTPVAPKLIPKTPPKTSSFSPRSWIKPILKSPKSQYRPSTLSRAVAPEPPSAVPPVPPLSLVYMSQSAMKSNATVEGVLSQEQYQDESSDDCSMGPSTPMKSSPSKSAVPLPPVLLGSIRSSSAPVATVPYAASNLDELQGDYVVVTNGGLLGKDGNRNGSEEDEFLAPAFNKLREREMECSLSLEADSRAPLLNADAQGSLKDDIPSGRDQELGRAAAAMNDGTSSGNSDSAQAPSAYPRAMERRLSFNENLPGPRNDPNATATPHSPLPGTSPTKKNALRSIMSIGLSRRRGQSETMGLPNALATEERTAIPSNPSCSNFPVLVDTVSTLIPEKRDEPDSTFLTAPRDSIRIKAGSPNGRRQTAINVFTRSPGAQQTNEEYLHEADLREQKVQEQWEKGENEGSWRKDRRVASEAAKGKLLIIASIKRDTVAAKKALDAVNDELSAIHKKHKVAVKDEAQALAHQSKIQSTVSKAQNAYAEMKQRLDKEKEALDSMTNELEVADSVLEEHKEVTRVIVEEMDEKEAQVKELRRLFDIEQRGREEQLSGLRESIFLLRQ
ncbi:hypothetical protein FA15DRAFT_720884 [Coprinopsis marcescibilis]|uniref:Uncharacterized protein n=1 Tax=Coprinopsis marcescibilis TaxID=230819 RepID=A0A5C3L4S7_COPMA|nr:hypothetical protein FA15DRAFT_720884 [Coprinopsis marcescibilis]